MEKMKHSDTNPPFIRKNLQNFNRNELLFIAENEYHIKVNEVWTKNTIIDFIIYFQSIKHPKITSNEFANESNFYNFSSKKITTLKNMIPLLIKYCSLIFIFIFVSRIGQNNGSLCPMEQMEKAQISDTMEIEMEMQPFQEKECSNFEDLVSISMEMFDGVFENQQNRNIKKVNDMKENITNLTEKHEVCKIQLMRAQNRLENYIFSD